jgi:hypothetical protein
VYISYVYIFTCLCYLLDEELELLDEEEFDDDEELLDGEYEELLLDEELLCVLPPKLLDLESGL